VYLFTLLYQIKTFILRTPEKFFAAYSILNGEIMKIVSFNTAKVKLKYWYIWGLE